MTRQTSEGCSPYVCYEVKRVVQVCSVGGIETICKFQPKESISVMHDPKVTKRAQAHTPGHGVPLAHSLGYRCLLKHSSRGRYELLGSIPSMNVEMVVLDLNRSGTN